MIHTMEEIRKQQQQQDKMAGYLAIPVILIVTILTKLSGQMRRAGKSMEPLLFCWQDFSLYCVRL